MKNVSSEVRVRSSEWRDQDLRDDSSEFLNLRTPNSALRTSAGFAYIALLVAIVIIGISLGAAGKYWQNVMLRDKEEELLFRGDQYRQAIERYYKAKAPNQYPSDIDALLADPRFPDGKRHLRQKYKDPLTGGDFEIITTQTITTGVPVIAQQTAGVPGIIGVHSGSDKEPLKKDNFPAAYQDFAGKSSYSDWKFVASVKSALLPFPGKGLAPHP